jgi:hypothetical protein
MENISVKGYHDDYFVPTVDFNADLGVCELSGESYLEDTVDFYAPLLNWLREYKNEGKKPITFNFKLTYFNTSSSRCILDILYILKEYEEDGGEVTVNWFFDKDDIDMEEEVEDYTIESELAINLIPFDKD